jgi:threo-3-hydroxy-L-aspartate ammonia-lyase
MEPLGLGEFRSAAQALAGIALVTPVVRSKRLDALLGATVFGKDESQQRAGSFKFRGAYHRLSRIPDADRSRGVVAVSSGNHGAAVACAAQLLGMPATIHVPADAPAVKLSLIRSFGAQVVTFDRSTPDREAPARAQAESTGATFVHPFEDRDVMLGQGTAALEFHEQVGALDVLIVPMSGGGLMAGCGSAMRLLVPSVELIGVEPAAADDTKRSFAAGERITIPQPTTIADGLAVTAPGVNTFEINRAQVDDVVTVTDADLVDALRVAHDLLHRRLEPSGAAGLAALLIDPHRFTGRRIGVILSGGNIDEERFDELIVS